MRKKHQNVATVTLDLENNVIHLLLSVLKDANIEDRRSNLPSALSACDELYLSIVNPICHGQEKVPLRTTSSKISGDDSIMISINSLFMNQKILCGKTKSTSDSFFDVFPRWCENHISISPPLRGNESQIGNTTTWGRFHISKYEPLYYLVINLMDVASDQYKKFADIFVPSDTSSSDIWPQLEGKKLIQASINSSDFESKIMRNAYRWNWHHVNSPFQVFDFHAEAESTITSDAEHSNPFYNVFWESTTSLSGEGMHRALTHNIVATGSSSASKNEDTPEKSIFETITSGEIVLLHHLTESLFVDVEDSNFPCNINLKTSAGTIDSVVLLHEMLSCKVELVTPLDRVINIEQPSFSSPQNMIAYRIFIFPSKPVEIDNRIELGKSKIVTQIFLSLEIVFTTTLHFRYPSPIIARKETIEINDPSVTLQSTFKKLYNNCIVNVTVPQVVMYSAKCVCSTYAPNTSFAFPLSKHQFYQYPNHIMKTTAAGCESDFVIVVITSLLFTLFGSLVLMKDISRASKWD